MKVLSHASGASRLAISFVSQKLVVEESGEVVEREVRQRRDVELELRRHGRWGSPLRMADKIIQGRTYVRPPHFDASHPHPVLHWHVLISCASSSLCQDGFTYSSDDENADEQLPSGLIPAAVATIPNLVQAGLPALSHRNPPDGISRYQTIAHHQKTSRCPRPAGLDSPMMGSGHHARVGTES